MKATIGLLVTAIVAAGCGGGGGLDDNGKAACDLAARVETGGDAALIDTVIDELKAVQLAKRSTVDGLRAAGATTSQASQLDPDNPLYANPGDVAYDAVASWCKRHG